jgi:glycosyltransferase involved in cell wall biosynthesis
VKVLLLGNYLNDGQESMQRFASLMERGLKQAGHEVRILRPPAFVGQLHPSGQGFGKWLGYIDKFGVFPLILRSAIKWADVVHICDHANSFYIKHLGSVPHVVTCHDMLAIRSALGEIPQHRTSWTGRQLQRLILRRLADAQHVVCVSEATCADLSRVAGISRDRISRVYNSLNYPYSRMDQKEAALRIRRFHIDPGQDFLMHVGGNQWYKNRLGVLRIFSLLRNSAVGHSLKLVMVGKPWTTEMRNFVAENRMSDATLELTKVADEDLRALYSTATLMLFPSLQEGFGWPIIEAHACGCPVVTSNGAPMDEVGGTAAAYVAPENSEEAAATVKNCLESLTGMRESSLQNAVRFSEPVMIEGYVALFHRVCSESSARHAPTLQNANGPM